LYVCAVKEDLGQFYSSCCQMGFSESRHMGFLFLNCILVGLAAKELFLDRFGSILFCFLCVLIGCLLLPLSMEIHLFVLCSFASMLMEWVTIFPSSSQMGQLLCSLD